MQLGDFYVITVDPGDDILQVSPCPTVLDC